MLTVVGDFFSNGTCKVNFDGNWLSVIIFPFTNLSPIILHFGPNTFQAIYQSDTEITFILPPGSGFKKLVAVEVNGYQSLSNILFYYNGK